MSEPARNRFALDLEDLERQLRGAAQPSRPGQGADPLAELTRIVGQDDPLKDLFAPKAPQPQPRPVEIQTQDQSHAYEQPHAGSAEGASSYPQAAPAVAAAPPADIRGALDEFEALLRRTEVVQPQAAAAPSGRDLRLVEFDDRAERYRDAEPAVAPGPRDLDEGRADVYQPAYQDDPLSAFPEQPELAEMDAAELEPRRSRKGLWTAAALIAVGAVGVSAAMYFRGGSSSTGGQPPLIAADGGPVKIAPANPGGTEIPNQNKQIYERPEQAAIGGGRIVSREEQPVDVQQAARALPASALPAAALPIDSAARATPAPALALAPATPEPSQTAPGPVLTPPPAIPGLGEPRRVRTVAIRPDGTPIPAPGASVAYAASDASATVSGGPVSTASAAPPRRPAAAPDEQRTAEPIRTPEPAKQQARATPQAATTPAPAPVRVASPPPTPAAPAPRGGTGDFAVQLAAPGSESEARATFSALQRKYPAQLSGQAPIVRRTELAGKTVFRLRVGPYTREEAATMCTQLQSAGGQCFIAKL